MRAPLPGQCKAGNRSASLCIDWSEGVRKKEKENEKEIDLKKKNCSTPLLSGLMYGGWKPHWLSSQQLYYIKAIWEWRDIRQTLDFSFSLFYFLMAWSYIVWRAWGFSCLELHGIKERISAVMVICVWVWSTHSAGVMGWCVNMHRCTRQALEPWALKSFMTLIMETLRRHVTEAQ